MGFYGTVFYQAVESFTQILLKNKKDNIFPSENQEDVLLTPDRQNAQLILAGGNHWINLSRSDENSERTCEIYHTQALDDDSAKEAVITSLSTSTKFDNVPELSLDTDDIYITYPIVKYDTAGHIISIEDSGCFKIKRMETAANLENLENEVADLKEQVEKDIGELSKTVTEADQSVQEAIQGIHQYDSRLDSLDNITETLTQNIATLDNAINAESKRIGLLEQTVDTHTDLLDSHNTQLEEQHSDIELMDLTLRGLAAEINDLKNRIGKLEAFHPDTVE